ncbi:MAG: hypothetical protein PHZ19_10545 [Candidatus Thermoplasmatota archaeon]|nr:hypothetical protein [Candidatus Thermoplasmatota archaeon]
MSVLSESLYIGKEFRVDWSRLDGNFVVFRRTQDGDDWEAIGAMHALDIARCVEQAEADYAARTMLEHSNIRSGRMSLRNVGTMVD